MSWAGVDKARSGQYKVARKPQPRYALYKERYLEEFSKPQVGMQPE
jgi:hypothetical protein